MDGVIWRLHKSTHTSGWYFHKALEVSGMRNEMMMSYKGLNLLQKAMSPEQVSWTNRDREQTVVMGKNKLAFQVKTSSLASPLFSDKRYCRLFLNPSLKIKINACALNRVSAKVPLSNSPSACFPLPRSRGLSSGKSHSKCHGHVFVTV